MTEIKLSSLNKNDINEIVNSFREIGWDKSKEVYENYLEEQSQKLRTIFIAKVHNKFAGYVTLKWISDYSYFSQNSIPEIKDLNVIPTYRNMGVGTRLIKACEDLAKNEGCRKIGLGVGLIADYGNAQRLYVSIGYIPDGRGMHYKGISVVYFQEVIADDDLVLYFEKDFTTNIKN